MAPTTRICRTAGAKLNLALHVRGKRADGYHALDSVFVHCLDGDEMWVEPADDVSLTVTGPCAAGLGSGADNLVMRAARLLADAFADFERPAAASQGAAITLVKNLPLASGIGGGSADAAMTVEMLAALWHLPDDDARLQTVASSLGADVPPCRYRWPKHVLGRGEDFVRLRDPAYRDWPVLLANPGVALATGAIFAGWDGVDRGGLQAEPSFADVLAIGRNDLAPPAIALAPVIADVLEALARQPGCVLARMSGSGATCFALFGSAAERDAAHRAIRALRPDWWTMATRLA